MTYTLFTFSFPQYFWNSDKVRRKHVTYGCLPERKQNVEHKNPMIIICLSLSLCLTPIKICQSTPANWQGRKKATFTGVSPLRRLLLGDKSMHTMCHSVPLQQSPSLFLFHPFISQASFQLKLIIPRKQKKNRFFPS